jgi:hypothetical protein
MRVMLAFLIGLAGSLTFGWLGFPHLLYRAESQPLPFNHQVHKQKGEMECSSCHDLTPDGQFTGIPKMEGCAGCHAEPLGTTDVEKKFVSAFVTPNREVEWKVYSRQPINVRFSHAVHTKKAELKCEECHGDHGASATTQPFYRNRISGESRNIWGPRMVRVGLKPGDGMKMADCEQCHDQRGVAAGCLGCHR